MPLPPDLRLEPGAANRLLSAFGDPGVARLADGTRAIFDGRSAYLAGPEDATAGPYILLADFLAGSRGHTSGGAVTALAGGGLVVTAAHPVTPGLGRAQILEADGALRGPAFDLPGPPEAVVGLPGGGFAVLRTVWQPNDPGINDDTATLLLQRYTPGGTPAGAADAITGGTWPFQATGVSAEALDDGRIAVAWHREPDRLQIAFVDGAAASAPVLFGMAGERSAVQQQPLIVERGDGGLALFWADSSSSLYMRLLGPNGAAQSDPVLVIGRMGFGTAFDAIEAPDGRFVVAYKAASQDALRLAILRPDGQPVMLNHPAATGLTGIRLEGFAAGSAGDEAGPRLFLVGTSTLQVSTVQEIDLGVLPFTTLGAGGDVVTVGPFSGPIDAGRGDDTVTGSGSDDTVMGSAGDDILDFSAGGANRVDGGTGTDRVVGGAQGDLLIGGAGRDVVNGGGGNDTLFGGGRGDGDLGDVIVAGTGDDMAHGGAGNDQIFGMSGADTLTGDAGADTLAGQDGDDVLAGGAGGDLLFGNAGADVLRGGAGQDRLHGGAGADAFLSLGPAGDGPDWVADLAAAEGDTLVFLGAGATAADFQVNIAATPGAGDAGVDEVFVIHRPTGAIVWALVDGAGQDSITLRIGGEVFDLL
jgi:hypothetical protein